MILDTYYSNGKLLLTGEYLVLDGALALAVPTKFGQSLQVKPINDSKIIWKSLDENESIWFKSEFNLKTLEGLSTNSSIEISNRLSQILKEAQKLNSEFLNTNQGFEVKTKLTFPREWGLGTSSTLVNNIAQWAKVNAFSLLYKTFGGSGYDIACAQHNTSITYQINGNAKNVSLIDFKPSFSENLFFIYLNQKQDSRKGIQDYRQKSENIKGAISDINSITKEILNCQSLSNFETLIEQHESILSKILDKPIVKNSLFPDYKHAIKSLGAWGGDFVLATGTKNDMTYFKKKGYHTIIKYKNMIL